MKTISTFVIALLVFSFFFLALPEKGYSGIGIIPPCPCDTAELSDGLTGNEIVDIICPGGILSEDSSFILERDEVFIHIDIPPKPDYQVSENNIGDKHCTINSDGVLHVTIQITDEEYELCRERLILGCNLSARNVPTLSEWGLIAMAAGLGILGFMVIRRRKVTA